MCHCPPFAVSITPLMSIKGRLASYSRIKPKFILKYHFLHLLVDTKSIVDALTNCRHISRE